MANSVVYRQCPFSPFRVPVSRGSSGYICLIGRKLECGVSEAQCSEYIGRSLRALRHSAKGF